MAPKKSAVVDDTWSPAEVEEHIEGLKAEVARLQGVLDEAQSGLTGLVEATQDIAGDDQADVGSKAIEREHEVAMAHNTKEMLAATEHALERAEQGLQGTCESCGGVIPKLRVQAFPRATLCVACKSAQSR